MVYFTQDFVDFFNELSKNNKKEWFDLNRKRYEKNVKQPFAYFINELIDRVKMTGTQLDDLTAKESVMRINRDIRFAKDKTPYNTHVSAIVSPTGRKDKSIPGLFVKLQADAIFIAGGAHSPDKVQLLNIRRAIANEPDKISKIVGEADFKEKLGNLKGDINKRIPPEFAEAVQKQPFIANKQFYYYTEIDGKHILQDDLIDVILSYYLAGKELNSFLLEAIKKQELKNL